MDTKTLEAIANNPNFSDKQLLTELSELLSDKPEAVEYLYLYGQLCEVMDDLVDGDGCAGQLVEQAGLIRCKLSVCAYWLKNLQHLWMTERLIHHQYVDVIEWEKSDIQWHREHAKALSHCAYNMFFAVIQLEFGDEKLRELSLRFRHHAHLKHINDLI